MKKVIILTVLATWLVVLASCEKEPQVVPTPTFSISTIVIGKGLVIPEKLQGITLGSDVNFWFTPEKDYSLYSVEINDVKVEDIYPSSTEAQYIVRGVNKNLNMEVNFVETRLLVVSVKSTQEDPWKWIKLDIYKASDNTFIRPSTLTQAEKDRRYYFVYPSMELIVLNSDNSLYFKGTWDLKQNTFNRASEVMTIWEISDKKIVIAAPPIWSNADNCYIYVVYTYERKTN